MKRSSQVALLLMGVTGVGATGYVMSRPPPNCVPQGSPAATVAPATPGLPAAEPCPPRRSWSSSGYYRSGWTRTNSTYYGSSGSSWQRPVFSRGTPTGATQTSAIPGTSMAIRSPSSSSASVPRSATTTTTTRSGFGSTASSHSPGS